MESDVPCKMKIYNRTGSTVRLVFCVLVIAFVGCKSKIELHTSNAGAASASATSLKPITAKPGDIVSLTGTGFSARQKNLVKITTARGEEVTAPVTVTSETAATFVMPEGAGLGLTSVVFESNGKQMTGAMGFVANLSSNALPILIVDQSEVCSSKQYIDRNGDTQTGTKDCSASGGTTPACTADGVVGCVTTASYKSVDMANVTAGNIKSGVTIAGQAGSVNEAPANCSSAGQQSCVATGSYYAGSACSGDGSNCFLPSYSVMSQPLKAINYSSIDQTKMLDSLTISGVTGTVASRGSWNLTTAFPGTGYYTGTSNAPSAATILSSTTITGVAGTATASPSNCSSAGQQSCVATGTYFAGTACTANSSACYLPTYTVSTQPLKAISYDAINSSAASIRSGTTLGAVAGTLADCSADGATGCVTTSSYKSANMTNVTAGNIKSGVTIAGQLGDFPSATYRLTDDTATADLDAATFNAKVKSATAFEYWDSAGSRQTGAGDADIAAGNIKDTVSIFGTDGAYTGSAGSAPNAWDVRVGTVVNGVTGKLKVNCRNRANPSLFDIDQGQAATITTGSPGTVNITAHGLANTTTVRINYSTAPTGLNNGTTYYVVNAAANTLQLSLTSGGAAINITGAGANVTVHKWQASPQFVDIWDTIDDYNNGISGIPGTVVSGWSDNDCGGVESVAGDGNVWKDVTTSNGVTASSCGTTATNCTMQDKITGLWWSKQQTDAAWNVGLSTCGSTLNGTTYAGNSVAGYNGQTGWRLPTQKEIMDAYNHGIRSAASTNWITEAAMGTNVFWSASSVSHLTYGAWAVNLANGSTLNNLKNGTGHVVCVR